MFAAGSVTKQFTAACVFLLAEDGKLSVRDPVAKWYPELTRAKEITPSCGTWAGGGVWAPTCLRPTRRRRPS